MLSNDQILDIIDLLSSLNSETKIYLGCDSVKFTNKGKKYAKYATILVIHMNGKNGCKIFSNISIEPDYDSKLNRPSTRLMNEVIKVCQLYIQISPFIDEYDIEIHLDIGLDPLKNASSCVATQAAGYVLGVTGLSQENIKFKPDSWCSSIGADGIVHGKLTQL
jgi:predicted RNase H-related nuclease YkuK (DUF458 family)